jgi:hypothetical protein
MYPRVSTRPEPCQRGYIKSFFYSEAIMKKSMSEITVKADKDTVFITQPNFQSDNDEDIITLSKDQINLLIEWLIEARDEVLNV